MEIDCRYGKKELNFFMRETRAKHVPECCWSEEEKRSEDARLEGRSVRFCDAVVVREKREISALHPSSSYKEAMVKRGWCLHRGRPEMTRDTVVRVKVGSEHHVMNGMEKLGRRDCSCARARRSMRECARMSALVVMKKGMDLITSPMRMSM